MKAAFRNVIRHTSSAHAQTRVLAIVQPVDLFYMFVALCAATGLLITSSIISLTRTFHPNFKPSISLTLPRPANVGVISINTIEKNPATIVMAGDSLARGKGSRIQSGTLANIGYYLAQKANATEPGIARYQEISDLSVDGSPVEDLNSRLSAKSETLATIPNLVLVMSFTNRDLVNFVVDAKNAQSDNKVIEFFKVLGILHADSKSYQHSLSSLRLTLADLHAKRVKQLGSNKAAMQAVILGVPNEAYSPSVKAILHTYGLNYQELSYVINTYNADDQNAVIAGNNEDTGVSYSFVNLDRLQIPENTAVSYLSADQFHPNYRGYKSLADFVAQSVLVKNNSHSVFLANE